MAVKLIDITFEDGNRAYHDDLPETDNPYERGTPSFAAWRDGWYWGKVHRDEEECSV